VRQSTRDICSLDLYFYIPFEPMERANIAEGFSIILQKMYDVYIDISIANTTTKNWVKVVCGSRTAKLMMRPPL
jgi:hypothetical protein